MSSYSVGLGSIEMKQEKPATYMGDFFKTLATILALSAIAWLFIAAWIA